MCVCVCVREKEEGERSGKWYIGGCVSRSVGKSGGDLEWAVDEGGCVCAA